MYLKPLLVGVFTIASIAGFSGRADADICLQDDNTFIPTQYQLQIGTGNASIGTPIIVSGVRLVALLHRHPVFGTLQPNPLGGIMMSLETILDFGSGTWTQPVTTSLIRFGATTITYDTTGHGNGAPSNATGLLHVIQCPISNPAIGESQVSPGSR